MKHDRDIPLRVQYQQDDSQLPALLNELQSKLTRLANSGHCDSIDLRSLPLFPGDLERLKQCLGSGEVQIKLNAMGPSEIYETAVAGIWWITHYNQFDDIVAETLEITLLPDILKTAPADLHAGLETLQALLNRDNEYIAN